MLRQDRVRRGLATRGKDHLGLRPLDCGSIDVDVGGLSPLIPNHEGSAREG